jgi:hypothetical protein
VKPLHFYLSAGLNGVAVRVFRIPNFFQHDLAIRDREGNGIPATNAEDFADLAGYGRLVL